MKPYIPLKEIGETKLISYIEELIYENAKKELIRDDAFFYSLEKIYRKPSNKDTLIFNSDMLVSTTDVPKQMELFQVGRKSLIMNLSDLIVKGVKPTGLILSLGLPGAMNFGDFKQLMDGIISYSNNFDLDYIGGDLNETKEIIINPTVFGLAEESKVIYRNGMNVDDIIIANGQFGLTGVGFDILLHQEESYESFSKYTKSIESVLKPSELGLEGLILSENKLATASIDSSDGLAKSLRELKFSNPNKGFEIQLDENLVHSEVFQYSEEFNIPLEKLVVDSGEEFIHLFSVKASNFERLKGIIKKEGGSIFKIGKVISDSEIYICQGNKKKILKIEGYEHFT